MAPSLAQARDSDYIAPMHVVFFEASAPGDPRLPQPGEPGYRRPAPEPIVNAPWPVVVLTVGLIALYAVQSRFPGAADYLGFYPVDLVHNRFAGLITSQFLHGNWAHALMNAGFILAFGAPVSRFFGPSLLGAAGFFLFYLACGALACIGFAALHWGGTDNLIGASGAASGLMGAAARLIGGHGRVGPVFSRPVMSLGFAWILVNLVMAFAGGLLMGDPGASVGWEAHLAGFAAGVLLIGPFGWLAGRRA